jgi:hypothetical protein
MSVRRYNAEHKISTHKNREDKKKLDIAQMYVS